MKNSAKRKSKRQMRKGSRIAFKAGEPFQAVKIKGWEHSGHYVFRTSSRGSVKFD